jgi:hypothetical protein
MFCSEIFNKEENRTKIIASLKESFSIIRENYPSNYKTYIYELSRFENALHRYFGGKKFDIAGYTWHEVNPWRYILKGVPEGFCLIEFILENYQRWSSGQVSAALGLASSMSHSLDKVLADRSRTILEYLFNHVGKPTTCKNYQDYFFFHQYYYSLAQIDEKYQDICETFIHTNGRGDDHWELWVNREYYESKDDSKTKESLEKRLFNCNETSERDKYLSSILQLQYEIVKKYDSVPKSFNESNLQKKLDVAQLRNYSAQSETHFQLIQQTINNDLSRANISSFANKIQTCNQGTDMSESSEKYINNLQRANVANMANTLRDNSRQQANQYIHLSEEKKTLAEAASEIQKLLKQLEETNPTATEAEKVAYVNDETTPSFKRRVVGAFQAGGETAIDEFILENKYLKVAKAAIKGWLQPGS